MVVEAEAAFGSGSSSFSTNGGAWMNILKSEASIITSMTGCRVVKLGIDDVVASEKMEQPFNNSNFSLI
ncbi:uncharacterized protein G2W53_003420 [Senna tora]|uniref:Uncharacterized protein n=1 Tax=Senna tora TaxID=362788 RepID=A0A834XAT1_9FABA|nr:uncharacterized protein G2W53_003420 [Senna tora]